MKRRRVSPEASAISAETPQCCFCRENFDSERRPPKLLPCGDNFCDQCLFSLGLHSEYYLLDSIKCPKCGISVKSNRIPSAPTNFSLCETMNLLQKSEQNITVIHVDNCEDIPSTPSSLTASSGYSSEIPKSIRPADPTSYCFDCRRVANPKQRAVVFRFCQRCHGNAKRMRLICLECCVNRHNGHQLRSVAEIEAAQQRLVADLIEFDRQRKRFDLAFERRLSAITVKSREELFASLRRDRNLINEEMTLHVGKAMTEIQSNGLLHPNQIATLRQRPIILLGRLRKLIDSLKDNSPSHSTPISSPSKSSKSPKKEKIETEMDSTLKEAIESLQTTASIGTDETFGDIRQFALLLSADESSLETRIDVLKSAISALILAVDSASASMVLLLADSFRCSFRALNEMIPRRLGSERQRRELWKIVQTAFASIHRKASTFWTNSDESRVQIVADIAQMCSLFADVCDHSTITLCVIESSRSRAALSAGRISDRDSFQTMINLIDFHLNECRRAQKLAELCVHSRLKKRRRIHWFHCFGRVH